MKDLVKEEKQTSMILYLIIWVENVVRQKFDLINYYLNFNC